MANIITLSKSLNKALESAMTAAEDNDFEKSVNLLEYLKQYEKNYDEVLVDYMLLYGYYATNRLKLAQDTLQKLKDLKPKDPHIVQVMNEIEAELLLQNINESELKDITNHTISNLVSAIYENMDKNGGFDKVLSENNEDPFLYTLFYDEDNAEELEQIYLSAVELHSDIINLDKLDPIDRKIIFIRILNRINLNGFFWQFLTPQQYEAIVNDEENDDLLINAFIALSIHFAKYTNINKKVIKDVAKINYKDQKINIPAIFYLANYFDDYYKETDITLYNYFQLAYLVIGLYNLHDTKLVFEPKFIATLLYSVNDFNNYKENEVKIEQKTDFKRNELQAELNKIAEYFPFLK